MDELGDDVSDHPIRIAICLEVSKACRVHVDDATELMDADCIRSVLDEHAVPVCEIWPGGCFLAENQRTVGTRRLLLPWIMPLVAIARRWVHCPILVCGRLDSHD